MKYTEFPVYINPSPSPETQPYSDAFRYNALWQPLECIGCHQVWRALGRDSGAWAGFGRVGGSGARAGRIRAHPLPQMIPSLSGKVVPNRWAVMLTACSCRKGRSSTLPDQVTGQE